MAMTLSLDFKSKNIKSKGFTMVGLIAIILLLAAFTSAIYIVSGPSDLTRSVAVTMSRGHALELAIRHFKINFDGVVPVLLSNLVTTTGAPCAPDSNPNSSTYKQLKGWCGPYLDQPLASDANAYQTDGWGVNFSYNGVNLKSCGPDRTCGNADDLSFANF
jgi:type II secretory pathway pseudopilin PulG